MDGLRGEHFMVHPWTPEENTLRAAIAAMSVEGRFTFYLHTPVPWGALPDAQIRADAGNFSADSLFDCSCLLAKNLAYVTAYMYVDWLRSLTTILYGSGSITAYISQLFVLAMRHGVSDDIIQVILPLKGHL